LKSSAGDAKVASADAKESAAAPHVDSAMLQQYVGKYKVTAISPNDTNPSTANMTLIITTKDDQIFVDMTGANVHTSGAIPFMAKGKDEFSLPSWGNLSFQRDEKGTVTKVVLGVPGHTFTGDKLPI
jgi:hypothetical protein